MPTRIPGVAVYDSTPDEGHVLDWLPVGGTSLASPLIASVFALAGGAGGVEYPAKTLYENEVKAAGSLHDIESGSNGECSKPFNETTGVSGCTALEEAAGCSGKAICLAGPGYDGPTGVGTPNGIGAFEPAGKPVKKPQLIEFTSSAPHSATVGGPTYTLTATASSGLAVSFSSGTLAVCSVEGATVSFIRAGTCTIDASQAGNASYEAAPQAQQSFAVGTEPTLVSTPLLVSPVTPPLTSPLTPPLASPLTPPVTPTVLPTPNSNFSLLGNPTIDPRTGAVTFTASAGDPGTFSWLLTFPNGRFGAFRASRTTCDAGQIELNGECRRAKIVFGKGNTAVAAAGIVSFTVNPSASAAKALKNALKKGQGLSVTAALTFQSSLGGSPVLHARSITDRLKKAVRTAKS
jgi:hypothetical protein